MHLPGLGAMTLDEGSDWLCSAPLPIAMLDGALCAIALEGYQDDPHPEDFHAAIAAFLSAGPQVLQAAQGHIFAYYRDVSARQAAAGGAVVAIASPGDLWRHIGFGDEAIVERRDPDQRDVYLSLSCDCDWEGEHGLLIVLKNGDTVCKVGPYDGHLSNADAYGDDSLEHVVYRSLA
jgi:hypothetical protein